MKPIAIVFILNLVFGSLSFAETCKVSGISDSPQSITCHYRDGWYHKMKMEIRCENGRYVYRELVQEVEVDFGEVINTYHEEVSRGTSPLNFTLKDQQVLRVSKVMGLFFRGEFHMSNNPPTGKNTFRCSVN